MRLVGGISVGPSCLLGQEGVGGHNRNEELFQKYPCQGPSQHDSSELGVQLSDGQCLSHVLGALRHTLLTHVKETGKYVMGKIQYRCKTLIIWN